MVEEVDEALAVKMAGRGSYQQWCEWLAEHRLAARREAIEEAADVAEQQYAIAPDEPRKIATAIRKLAEQ